MRYIKRRLSLWLARRRGGGYRRPSGRRRALLFLGLLVAALTGLCEWAISGVPPELTEEAARGYILDSIARAVEAELEADPADFVTVERESGGQVAMVSADQERLNRLRAGVLDRLSRDLKGKATAYVPVGSLTGVGLLNGRGFPVPVKLQLEGSAVVEFSTEFTGAGLNQTCHRLLMTVKARAYSPSKRFQAAVETESTTILSETMVVGEVPKWTVQP